MELGNILMGNSRGQFHIERGQGFEDELLRLFAACAKGDKDDFEIGYGVAYENDTFSIFPYYWGDCTCGFDQKEGEWDKQNEHEEKCYQTLVNNELKEKGLVDEKGHIKNIKEAREIEDSVQEKWCKHFDLSYPDGCAVHCTCSYKEKWHKFLEENDHIDCPIDKSNFLYKPTELEIQWYKYPLRDSYISKQITLEEFKKIIDACIESIKEEAKNEDNI